MITHDLLFSLLEEYYRNEVMRTNCTLVMTENVENHLHLVADFFAPRGGGERDKRKIGLFIEGGTGVGKTTMLRAINKLYCHLIDRRLLQSYDGDKYPHVVMATEIARMSVQNLEAYEILKNCDRLMIDDLGMEPTEVMSYGMPLHPIEDLLAYRYERRSKTIIATNFPYSILFCCSVNSPSKYKDPRLEDRIHETMHVVGFRGRSFR